MTRLAATCALLAIAATFSPAAPAGPAGKTYTSARYHFTVEPPAGWAIKAATVDAKAGRFPEGDHPETESFDGPSTTWTPEISIAAVKLKAGTTLAAWTRTTIQLIGKQF